MGSLVADSVALYRALHVQLFGGQLRGRLVLIETVSAVVGDELGSGVGNPPVGTNDGGSDSVGLGDGAMDGKAVGSSDGRRVGAAEGSSDGAAVGCALG